MLYFFYINILYIAWISAIFFLFVCIISNGAITILLAFIGYVCSLSLLLLFLKCEFISILFLLLYAGSVLLLFLFFSLLFSQFSQRTNIRLILLNGVFGVMLYLTIFPHVEYGIYDVDLTQFTVKYFDVFQLVGVKSNTFRLGFVLYNNYQMVVILLALVILIIMLNVIDCSAKVIRYLQLSNLTLFNLKSSISNPLLLFNSHIIFYSGVFENEEEGALSVTSTSLNILDSIFNSLDSRILVAHKNLLYWISHQVIGLSLVGSLVFTLILIFLTYKSKTYKVKSFVVFYTIILLAAIFHLAYYSKAVVGTVIEKFNGWGSLDLNVKGDYIGNTLFTRFIIGYGEYTQEILGSVIVFELVATVCLSIIAIVIEFYNCKLRYNRSWITHYYFAGAYISSLLIIWVDDLLILISALELLSFSLIVIINKADNTPKSVTSIFNFFIIYGVNSILLIFSVVMIWYITGTTSLVHIGIMNSIQFNILLDKNIYTLLFILAMLFKLGSGPFFFWVLDIVNFMRIPVLLFFLVFTKIVYLFVILKLLIFGVIIWTNNILLLLKIFAFISVVVTFMYNSYTEGVQEYITYSGFGHIGYILIVLSTSTDVGFKYSIMYFTYYILVLIIYILILSGLVKFNQFGLKGLNTIMHKNVSNLSICGFVLITMILAGLPPFIGFHAKVLVFTYLIYGSDYISLFLLGISASGIVYTYLRILTFVTCVVKNKTIYSYSTIVENLNWLINTSFKSPIITPKISVIKWIGFLVFVILPTNFIGIIGQIATYWFSFK